MQYLETMRQLFINSIKKRTLKNKTLKKIVYLFLLSVSVFFQIRHFLASGRLSTQGYVLNQMHDSLWHLALIKELLRSFPPQHPGIAGIYLRNYHYLSDLLLALTQQLTTIRIETLYFQLFPLAASLFFLLAIIAFTRIYVKSETASILSIFMVIFSGSAAFLIPWFLPEYKWQANAFMLDQILFAHVNIHTVLSFALVLFSAVLISRLEKAGKLADQILLGITVGLLSGIKAYAFLVLFPGLLLVFVLDFLNQRRIKFLLPLLLSLLIAFFLFSQTSDSLGSPLIFRPGWILDKMVEDSDRLLWPRITLLRQHYLSGKNLIGVVFIYAFELGLYFIGNYFTKLLSLIWIFSQLKNIKKNRLVDIFGVCLVVISCLIPLLFIQKSSAYDIIQFAWYSMLFMGVYAALFLEKLKKKFPQTAKLVILLIVFLSLPSTVREITGRHLSSGELIPSAEYEALVFLKNYTPPDAVILTGPNSSHSYFLKIPGIAGRRTYFSGEKTAIITQAPYRQRQQNQFVFFSPSTPFQEKINFLKDAKISHIYLESQAERAGLLKLTETGFPLKKIFENQAAVVYQVL